METIIERFRWKQGDKKPHVKSDTDSLNSQGPDLCVSCPFDQDPSGFNECPPSQVAPANTPSPCLVLVHRAKSDEEEVKCRILMSLFTGLIGNKLFLFGGVI